MSSEALFLKTCTRKLLGGGASARVWEGHTVGALSLTVAWRGICTWSLGHHTCPGAPRRLCGRNPLENRKNPGSAGQTCVLFQTRRFSEMPFCALQEMRPGRHFIPDLPLRRTWAEASQGHAQDGSLPGKMSFGGGAEK